MTVKNKDRRAWNLQRRVFEDLPKILPRPHTTYSLSVGIKDGKRAAVTSVIESLHYLSRKGYFRKAIEFLADSKNASKIVYDAQLERFVPENLGFIDTFAVEKRLDMRCWNIKFDIRYVGPNVHDSMIDLHICYYKRLK